MSELRKKEKWVWDGKGISARQEHLGYAEKREKICSRAPEPESMDPHLGRGLWRENRHGGSMAPGYRAPQELTRSLRWPPCWPTWTPPSLVTRPRSEGSSWRYCWSRRLVYSPWLNGTVNPRHKVWVIPPSSITLQLFRIVQSMLSIWLWGEM